MAEANKKENFFARTGKTLKNRAVLTVDGVEVGSAHLHRVHEKLAPADDAFLVGEKETLAGCGRREGRTQTRRTHNRMEHHVGIGVGRKLRRRPFARKHFRFPKSGLAERSGKFIVLRRIRDGNPLHSEFPRRLDKRLDAAAACERMDFKALALKTHDVKRRSSDAAGCAENGDFLFLMHSNHLTKL